MNYVIAEIASAWEFRNWTVERKFLLSHSLCVAHLYRYLKSVLDIPHYHLIDIYNCDESIMHAFTPCDVPATN